MSGNEFRHELHIEWRFLASAAGRDLNHWKTIKRCFDEALCDIESYGRPRGVKIRLTEVPLQVEEKGEANIILFNGVPIEDLLSKVKISEKERNRNGLSRVFIVAAATKIINSFQEETSLEDPELNYCYSLQGSLTKKEYQERLKKYLLMGAICLFIWCLLYANLSSVSNWFIYKIVGLDARDQLGTSFFFSFYYFLKSFLLILLVSFSLSIAKSFYETDRVFQILTKQKNKWRIVICFWSTMIAPFTATPQKSAHHLMGPIIYSNLGHGPAFSFFVSALLLSDVLLCLIFGLMGLQNVLVYCVLSFFLALTIGIIMSLFQGKSYLNNLSEHHSDLSSEQSSIINGKNIFSVETNVKVKWVERIEFAFSELLSKLKISFAFILPGILCAGFIHGYMIEGSLLSILGEQAWWGIPAAALASIFSLLHPSFFVPIIEAFSHKGLASGISMAFLFGCITLSFLKLYQMNKIYRWSFIAIYVVVMLSLITGIGFIFNELPELSLALLSY